MEEGVEPQCYNKIKKPSAYRAKGTVTLQFGVTIGSD